MSKKKDPRSLSNKFSDTMTRELLRAIEGYEFDNITALIDAGADVNARNEDGLTCLHIAARDRNDEVVKLLLAHHADINAVAPENGYTALHYAANNSDTDTLKVLLDAKANTNIADKTRKQTPLHIAADEGDEENVKLLVAAGANVLAKDMFKHTPAQTAEAKANETLHFMAETYHKITVFLVLEESYAHKAIADRAAEEAKHDAVERDLEQLRKNHNPNRFKLKPPGK